MGLPLLRGQRGAPSLVTPTPTLSLLDRVSRCKPQAPRGFSSVTGSGQICLGPARGAPGCLSPAFPRAQPVTTPAAAGPLGPGGLPQPGAPQAPGVPSRPPAAGPEPSGHRLGREEMPAPGEGPRGQAAWLSLRQDPRNRGGRPGGQTGLGVTPGGAGGGLGGHPQVPARTPAAAGRARGPLVSGLGWRSVFCRRWRGRGDGGEPTAARVWFGHIFSLGRRPVASSAGDVYSSQAGPWLWCVCMCVHVRGGTCAPLCVGPRRRVGFEPHQH